MDLQSNTRLATSIISAIACLHLCDSSQSTLVKMTKCSKCRDKVENILCQGCHKKQLIDNSVLMYVSSYLSKSARLNIKNAVLNFYSADAIAAARQVFEDCVKELIPDHSCVGKKRTDSVRRTASDAMLDDILEWFSALDKMEGACVPQFVICYLQASCNKRY